MKKLIICIGSNTHRKYPLPMHECCNAPSPSVATIVIYTQYLCTHEDEDEEEDEEEDQDDYADEDDDEDEGDRVGQGQTGRGDNQVITGGHLPCFSHKSGPAEMIHITTSYVRMLI